MTSIQNLQIDGRLKRLAREAFADKTKTIEELNRENMIAIMDQNGVEHGGIETEFDKAVRKMKVRPVLQDFIIESYDHGRKSTEQLHAETMALMIARNGEPDARPQRPNSGRRKHWWQFWRKLK